MKLWPLCFGCGSTVVHEPRTNAAAYRAQQKEAEGKVSPMQWARQQRRLSAYALTLPDAPSL